MLLLFLFIYIPHLHKAVPQGTAFIIHPAAGQFEEEEARNKTGTVQWTPRVRPSRKDWRGPLKSALEKDKRE